MAGKTFNVSLMINMGGNFEQQAQKTIRTTTALQTRLGRVQVAAKKMQAQFMSGLKLAAPIAAVGFFAAKYEEGLAKLSTVTNLTLDQVKSRLSGGLKDIARETGQNMGNILEAAYQASSAGVSNEQLLKATRTAARLAVGGFTDVKTAVDALTNVQNVWGVSMEKAADIFINTQNLGKTTVGEIGRSIAQVSNIAKTAGISFEEISASVAALTKTGLPTAEAFTAIRGSITALLKQSPKQAKALRAIGSNFSLQTVATQGYGKSLVNLITKVNSSTKSENRRKKILSDIFGRVEGLNAVLGLTAKEGQATFDKAMQQNIKTTGSSKKAFETMSKTTAAQFRRMKVELQLFAIEIGSVLLPAINSIIGAIKPVFRAIGDWGKRNKGLVKGLGIAIATLAGLKIAIGAIGFVIGPVVGLIKGATIAMGVFKKMALLTSITLKGALVATGIGAVIVGIGLLIANWDLVIEKLKEVVGWLKSVVDGAVKALKKVKDVIFSSAIGGAAEEVIKRDPRLRKRAEEEGIIKPTAGATGGGGASIQQKNEIRVTVNANGNPQSIRNQTMAGIMRAQEQNNKRLMDDIKRRKGQ